MIFFMYLLIPESLKCFQMLQLQLSFKEFLAWQSAILVSLDCCCFCKLIALGQGHIGTPLSGSSAALPFPLPCPTDREEGLCSVGSSMLKQGSTSNPNLPASDFSSEMSSPLRTPGGICTS